MPRYAVKLGEIHLVSDEPITPEQRREIIQTLKKDFDGSALAEMIATDTAVLRLDSHGHRANVKPVR